MSMMQSVQRAWTPLIAALETPCSCPTLRVCSAGQAAARASRPASPTPVQPLRETLRREGRERPREMRPESVTELLPRSRERSLWQEAPRLARLQVHVRVYFILQAKGYI